jgi:hypothetical protein
VNCNWVTFDGRFDGTTRVKLPFAPRIRVLAGRAMFDPTARTAPIWMADRSEVSGLVLESLASTPVVGPTVRTVPAAAV